LTAKKLSTAVLARSGPADWIVAMLAAFITKEASAMNPINVARARLDQAAGLPAILDAAYDAFEEMLRAIADQQDPVGGAFAAFVMAGAAAANGRDAVAAAPSLPPAASGDLDGAVAGSARGLLVGEAAAALARLSQLLVSRLTGASDLSADIGDRVACAQAARHAASICSLLGGAPEP
jgi:hypothetical protein